MSPSSARVTKVGVGVSVDLARPNVDLVVRQVLKNIEDVSIVLEREGGSLLLFMKGLFGGAEGALPKPKGPFSQENEAQERTPKLLALAKVCSVLGNIRDISWHLLRRGSELEKR